MALSMLSSASLPDPLGVSALENLKQLDLLSIHGTMVQQNRPNNDTLLLVLVVDPTPKLRHGTCMHEHPLLVWLCQAPIHTTQGILIS